MARRLEHRNDADRDTLFTRFVRSSRHPLRALTMSIAIYSLIADVAMSTGITAAILGTLGGIVAGELLAGSRMRLGWILGGLAGVAAIALGLGWITVHVEAVVGAVGTGGALHLASFLEYGGLAFFAIAAMRATAKRHPSWQALELATIVLGIAVALSAHRHGVIARPLWLSDLAWRRGVDPADVLIAIGVAAALVSVSLLLFERKGRLSLAALPLIPLVAMLAVSCFEVTREDPDLGETSPDATDEDGDPPEDSDTPPDDQRRGGDEGDASVDRDGGVDRMWDGGAPLDGGRGRDGGVGDGGSSRGGADGGGGGGGGGDASTDGGRGGGGGDGGRGGGSGSEGDGGGGGAGGDGGASRGGDAGPMPELPAWDAGVRPDELPDSRESQGGDQSGGPVNPQDIDDQPPPTGEGSSAPVAVVLFERDYSAPSETYYFRQEAWSQLDGRRLVPTTLESADRDLAHEFPAAGRLTVDAPPPELGRLGVVTTVALLMTHPVPFGLESPVWFGDARNPNPSRFRRAYRVMSRAQTISYRELVGRRAGDPGWPDEVRQLYLEPHPDPRFQAFADETIAQMPEARRDDPFSRAVAIKLRLDSLLTYSTRERHADSEDPAADFFFGNRIGYCVHFAHTAVYLFRAAGIPARIGVGYMSAESNRRGGSALVIQGGDAHAWPELYVEGIGWIVLDIAAARNLDPPRPAQDEDLQQLLGEMAREEPADPEEEHPDRRRTPGPPLGTTLMVLFAIALFVTLGVLYAIKIWRRVAPVFAPSARLPRVAYRAALDRLAEVGWVREHGETREQFAKRVAAIAPSFERATTMLLAASLRPGGPAAGRSEHDRAKWRETTAAMRLELRREIKGWRRLVGWLHPLAFLDSR